MNNQQQNPVLLKNWEYWLCILLPTGLIGSNSSQVTLFFVVAMGIFPILRWKAIRNSFNTPQGKWRVLTAFGVELFFIFIYFYGR